MGFPPNSRDPLGPTIYDARGNPVASLQRVQDDWATALVNIGFTALALLAGFCLVRVIAPLWTVRDFLAILSTLGLSTFIRYAKPHLARPVSISKTWLRTAGLNVDRIRISGYLPKPRPAWLVVQVAALLGLWWVYGNLQPTRLEVSGGEVNTICSTAYIKRFYKRGGYSQAQGLGDGLECYDAFGRQYQRVSIRAGALPRKRKLTLNVSTDNGVIGAVAIKRLDPQHAQVIDRGLTSNVTSITIEIADTIPDLETDFDLYVAVFGDDSVPVVVKAGLGDLVERKQRVTVEKPLTPHQF